VCELAARPHDSVGRLLFNVFAMVAEFEADLIRISGAMNAADGSRAVPGPRFAVVFDLDGVLVNSTAVVERAWRRWADQHGVPAEEVLAVAHGRPARDVIARFAPHVHPIREAERLDDWELHDSEALQAIVGSRECVALARRGPWAVVTSGGRALATSRLRAVGLPVPAVLVTADDVVFGKPDPEPYDRARARLAVPAEACIAVEDAPAGVTAAKRAGMTVLAVTTTHEATELSQADAVLSSMHDVSSYLARAVR
jgi:sugar-phosphatase